MDRDLWQKLYDTCYLRVYSYLLTLSRDRSLAEDLTQSTFLKAFRSESYRGDADEVTWLCAIGKNLFLDEMRRNKRKAEAPPDLCDTEDSPEEKAVSRDEVVRIHMILHSLPDPFREVFELRVFGELSFAEIASVFGKTESWARVTYHRAKLQIKERMK